MKKEINLEDLNAGIDDREKYWKAECGNPGDQVGNGCTKYEPKWKGMDTMDLPFSMCSKCKHRGEWLA